MTTWTRQESNAHIERIIIIAMIVSDEALQALAPIYKPGCLTVDPAQTVARWCIEYHQQYGKAPGRHIQDIYDSARRGGLRQEQADLIHKFLSSILKEYEQQREGFNPKYAIDQAEKYFREVALRKLMEGVQKKIEAGDTGRALELVERFQTTGVIKQDLPPAIAQAQTVFLLEAPGLVAPFKRVLGEGEEAIALPERYPSNTLDRFRGKDVVVIEGLDSSWNCQSLINNLLGIAGSLRVVPFDFPSLDTDEPDKYLRMNLGLSINGAENLVQKTLKWALQTQVMGFMELYDLPLPEIKRLCGPIEHPSITMISSPAGVGKTFLAMEVAFAVANGRPAMSGLWEVPQAVPVLYIDGEMLPQKLLERAWMMRMGKCRIITKAFFENEDIRPPLNLAEEKVREELLKTILGWGFRLVVLDNIYSLITGLDLNSASEWEQINLWLLRLRAKGVSVIVIHHTGKNESNPLGTASRDFNIDLSLVLRKADAENDNCSFSIVAKKQRERDLGVEGKIYQYIDKAWSVTDDKKSQREMIKLTVVKMTADNQSLGAIAQAVKKSKTRVSQIRKELVAEGLFEEFGETRNKKYSITDNGRVWLEENEGEGD